MKKVVNLLTKITKKIVSKIKREKINKELEFAKKQKKIKEPKSILFSDCGNCWQVRGKPNNTQNNQLLKRVLFWREEYNENKTNEKRGEKSMGRRGSEELINNGLKIKNKLAICMLMVLMMMVIPGINLFGNEVKAAIRGVMYDFYGENYTYEDLLYEPGDSEENSNRDYHFYITPNEGYVIKSVEIDYIYARVEDFNSYGNENEWNVVYTYPTEYSDLYEFSVTVTTEKGIDWSKALITEWTIPVDADQTNGTTTTNAEGNTITLGPQTTIKLPIPTNTNNSYTVDWGDGSATQTFDATADFPTHTYTNTEVTTYTIKVTGTVDWFGYISHNSQPGAPTATNSAAKYYTFTQYLTGLKSWGEIGASRYGFPQCQNLSSTIPEPSENTFENVYYMQNLFYNCTKLSGSIPENLFASAKNATSFANVFEFCTNLTGSIPANLFANTVNATSFGATFSGCAGLTGEIPGDLFANTPNITGFGTTFSGCSGLTGMIPEDLFANAPNVTGYYAFYRTFLGCKGLTGIPENLFANTTNEIAFVDTFINCTGLTGSIPENLFANTPNVTHFNSTFENCSGLTGSIPENLFANTPNVTHFNGTFGGCSSLTGSISENLFAQNQNVTQFNGTFRACSNLTGTIPEKLFANNTEVVSFSGTFKDCKGITGNIPEKLFETTSKVTTFDNTFYNCSGLTGEIPVNLFKNTPVVTNFAYTFSVCKGLNGNIPADLFKNTPLVTKFNDTFYDCSGLNGEIPSNLFANTPNVITFRSIFNWCSGLTGEIPVNLFEKTPLVKDFSYTFSNCRGLSGEVPVELFASNTVITTIPSEWKVNDANDGFCRTFWNCTGITSANIDTTYLGYEMFSKCNNLIDITIGNNVQGIATDAFLAEHPYNANNLLPTTIKTANSVAENYDWLGDFRSATVTDPSALITEWTIPVDTDGEGLGTTILLPIPAHANNAYTVDWGDGSATQTFDETADFPTHNYKNTTTTTYTIKITGTLNSFGYTGTSYPTSTNNQKKYYSLTAYLKSILSWGELNATRYGFACCTALNKIEDPSENTFKNVTNMSYMFYQCTGYKESIPENLFKGAINAQNFGYAFMRSKFTGSIPAKLFADTTKATSFSYTFRECYGLTGTIPGELFANTPNVTTFDRAFNTCTGLTGPLPGNLFANSPKVTNCCAIFNDCTKLTGPIPGELFANNPEVTDFSSLFEGCSKLSGSIPENLFEKNTKVINFGALFRLCSSLTGAIPEKLFLNTKEAVSFNAAFGDCPGLTGAIPEKLFENTEKASDFSWVFSGCSNLSGSIPEKLFEKTIVATSFHGAFNGCKSLTGSIPENLFKTTTEVTSFALTFQECSGLTGSISANLFRTTSKVTTFESTFNKCSGLTGNIPENLFETTVNTTSFHQTFWGCSSLTGNISPKLFLKTPEVTSFGRLFDGCSSLTGSIPEDLFINNTKVTNFIATFAYCPGLTGEIPEKLFSYSPNVTSFRWIFAGSSGLTGSIPAKLFESNTKVTDFHRAFLDCTGLIGAIPETLFEKNTLVTDFTYTFQNCKNLTGEIPANLFATTTNAYLFDNTFAECTGLTGHVSKELFSNTRLVNSSYEALGTFMNCSNITSAEVDIRYIGYRMFYGCNSLTDITIGDNVSQIYSSAFIATEPYNSENLLETHLTTNNKIAQQYDWYASNRGDGKKITVEPKDAIAKEYEEVKFTLEVSGDNLQYQWYEISSGDTKALTEENTRIFRSDTKGQANTTATSVIKLTTTDSSTLSFEYMVSSEENGDLFTVTLEDASGIVTVADGISGEVEWTEFSKECTPTDTGEIIITLTYAKNESVDSGEDYGAIRNLKYSGIAMKEFTFEEDDTFTKDPMYGILNPAESYMSPFVIKEEDGDVIFESDDVNDPNSQGAGVMLGIMLEEEATFSLDYRITGNSGDRMSGVMIMDGNGQKELFIVEEPTNGWVNCTATLNPMSNGGAIIYIVTQKMNATENLDSTFAIKNAGIVSGSEFISTFENDDVVTLSNTNWKPLSYEGTNSSTLTIPADYVTLDKDGNEYYCEVDNVFGTVTSRQALLTVEEPYDWDKALITEWTIPSNVDKTNGTTTTDANGNTITLGPQTTIRLPISKHNNNDYAVDWGDGSGIQKFDGTVDCPSHTYKNTASTAYEIKVAGTVDNFGYIGTPVPSATGTYTQYYPFTSYLTKVIQFGELNATKYGFSQCRKLTSLPTIREDNSFVNVTDMSYMFYYCTKLASLPDYLFASATNVTKFRNTFQYCSGIKGTIPENLFIGAISATDFYYTFASCTGFTGTIPGGLFRNSPEVIDFGYTFSRCEGLTGISGDLFKNTQKVKDFYYTFHRCTGLLGTLPVDLFANNTEVIAFTNTFWKCDKLTGIPNGLFANNTKVTSFFATFAWCESLTGNIPDDLFKYNTEAVDFTYVFQFCDFEGKIPENLFATTTKAEKFAWAFQGCDKLTGAVPANLFKNISNETINITYFESTFEGCSNLTSLEIDTNLIGGRMFYDCNKLTDITIGNNVQAIGIDAFEATSPYNLNNLLVTDLTSENEIVKNYNWVSDNRSAGKVIVTQPEDVMTKEYEETKFTVETTGNNLQYQWYEISSGDEVSGDLILSSAKELTEENTKIFKSNIKGQANATATSVIKLSTEETCTLSFDYMVTSEAGGDLFSVTIEDANGITTAVDGISGELEWTAYSKECTPTDEGEIIITLTYAKNASGDAGGDFGAIRNLKYDATKAKYFTFEEDNTFTKDAMFGIQNPTYSDESPFVVRAEDGFVIFESNDENMLNSDVTEATLGIILQEEMILTFEYRITGNKGERQAGISIFDGNGQEIIFISDEATDGWITYTTTIVPNSNGMAGIMLATVGTDITENIDNSFAIRNVGVITGVEHSSTFESDDIVTLSNTNWEALSYIGINTSTLTIPAEQVTKDLDGNKYYCRVSNNMGVEESRQALLTVEANVDWTKSMITEWTIPVDVNGAGNGTTIKLPIPASANNNYAVNWGDGSEVQTFNGTANFPTHTYKNTEETTYEISIAGTVDSFGYYEETEPNASDVNTSNYYTFTQYLTGVKVWGEIGVSRIGFANCKKLAKTIPTPTQNTFKNVTNMTNLFYGCIALSGNIPSDLFTSAINVTTFSGVFNGCKSLTGAIPENLFANSYKVTDFTSAFEGCSNITGNIPEGLFKNNPKVTTFESTFKECSNLEGTLPKNLFAGNKETQSFSNTFNGCNKVSGLVPGGLFKYNSKVTNFTSTFEGCGSITAAEIQANTDNITNMDAMFKNCTALESVVFGRAFRNLNGANMFENASVLRAVILLNQAKTTAEVGTASDLATLNLTAGACIYVPYEENAEAYEKAWTHIAPEKIERVVKAIPNPDYVMVGDTYVDSGYTVAGFGMNETEKYTQYGFYIDVSGDPVDTSEVGSEWLKYTLKKN